MPALKSCLATVDGHLCGRLFTPARTGQARCGDHDQQQAYGQLQRKRAIRPYDHGERLRREAAVTAHIAAHGYWCPGLPSKDRPAHTVTPHAGSLSADHDESYAMRGDESSTLTVRCIACNAAKGVGPA